MVNALSESVLVLWCSGAALRADALSRGKMLGLELDVEGLVGVVGLDGFFVLLKDGYCKFFAFSFYTDVEGCAKGFDLV